MKKIRLFRIYTHTNTGNKYFPIFRTMVKIQDEWVDAIIYIRLGKDTSMTNKPYRGKRVFVRTVEDFTGRFKIIKRHH